MVGRSTLLVIVAQQKFCCDCSFQFPYWSLTLKNLINLIIILVSLIWVAYGRK